MKLRARFQPLLIVVSAIVWTLLWGHLSIVTVIAGAILGLAIGFVFPMPPIMDLVRVRPLGLIRLIATLAYDLTRSSVAVMIVILRFGHRPRNAIIGVRLRTRNDLYLTQTAEMISLVPGTLVVEARRSTSTLYLHVLDVRGDDAEIAEATRRLVHATEARVVRAFGTRADIAALEADR